MGCILLSCHMSHGVHVMTHKALVDPSAHSTVAAVYSRGASATSLSIPYKKALGCAHLQSNLLHTCALT